MSESHSRGGAAGASTDAGRKEPLHECPSCDRSFDTEAGVKQHHYTVHGESIAGVEIECFVCGESKRKRPSHVNEGSHSFCGRECMGEWLSEVKKNKVAVDCAYCGSEFPIHPYRLEEADRHFCPGSDCYGEWQSENAIGQNGRHWKGGYDDYYGPNWPEQRRKARERDEYQCQSCGKSDEENGRGLPVHHIHPKREFVGENGDYDWVEGNRLENLITLCDSCHHKWEGIPVKPSLLT